MSSLADFLRYLVCRVHDGQKGWKLKIVSSSTHLMSDLWSVSLLIVHSNAQPNVDSSAKPPIRVRMSANFYTTEIFTTHSRVSLKVLTRVLKDSKRIDLQSCEREIHEWSSLFIYLFSLSFFASLAVRLSRVRSLSIFHLRWYIGPLENFTRVFFGHISQSDWGWWKWDARHRYVLFVFVGGSFCAPASSVQSRHCHHLIIK